MYILFKLCSFPRREIKIHWQLFKKSFLKPLKKNYTKELLLLKWLMWPRNFCNALFFNHFTVIVLYHRYYFHYLFGYSKTELSTNNDSDDNYWWHVSKCLFMCWYQCFHFKIERKLYLVASSVVIFSLSAMYYLTEFKYEDLCFWKGG